MGLYVHRSNRVEHLAVDLAAQIRLSAPDDPMVQVRVVVGSRGMERWLRHALAEQLGICAQVSFGFPSAVLGELLDAALGEPRPAPSTFWSPEVLAFALLRVLPSLEGEELEPLRRYLGPSAAAPWDRRAFGLARSLADVFDRYLLYRPDFVRAFESGELPAGLARDPDARLEAALFRALGALASEPHFVARAAELDRRTAPSRPLPARLHLFGLSSLPPAHMHVLASLGRFVGVDLYVLCPSDRYWGDLRTARETHAALRAESRDAVAGALLEHVERQSPLLTSLGRTSRDFQLVLEALPRGYEDAELFADPRTLAAGEGRSPTLLEGLQSDVLGLVSKAELREVPIHASRELALADDSFRVHACAGPSRQVEALRDVLLGLFDDYPTLEARDVLVMTPDVETYAPLVRATFDGDAPGGGRPKLRVQISDRTLSASNTVADALVRLLDLAEGRLTAAAALDLLALPVVHPRFDIDEADLPLLRRWASESGMRWAVDEHDRERAGQPATRANTLRFGLERIALGAVADDDALVLGALPLEGIDGSEGSLLAGRFLAFCEALFEHREALRAPGTVSGLAQRTRAALASLTSTDDRAARAAEEVHEAIGALEAEAEAAGLDAELTLDGYRRALEGRLDGKRGGDRPIASAITLCALSPMRSVPFRVICLLGMDDGAFPRPATAPGFDLAAREPRVGDRDPRDEDRHLLLEALLSARRHLRIFYTGRDPLSGEPRAPAVPVAELLGFVESTYAAAPPSDSLRGQLVIEHPLQPFSPAEHLPRIPDPRAPERLRPMGFDARMLEAAVRLSSPRAARVGPIEAAELEPLAPSRVELRDLVDFLRLPVRHLLRRRLGVVIDDRSSGLDDREPLELAGLERWSFERELLGRALEAAEARGGVAAIDWEALAAIARASGSLPPGTPGQIVLGRAIATARALLGTAAARTPEPLREQRFEHQVGSVAFEGALHVAGGRATVSIGHDSAEKPRRLLEAWVGLLALQAGTDAPCTARIIGAVRGDVEEKTLAIPGEPGERRHRARAILGDLLALRDEGLARPLLLFEKTSFAVAAGLASPKGASPEALFNAAMAAWNGPPFAPGEAEEPFVALAFPGASPPFVEGSSLAPELVELAARVYVPILDAGRAGKGSER